MTRKQRLLPRRVSGAAFLFVVCWMAAAGMWLLYGEPVFGEGRGELLSPELAADSGASTSEASSRQSFAHVRVPDIMEAGAPVDRDFVGEHFSEQPSSDITPPKGNTAESEAAGPTYTVTFSTSDYVGLELTPVWGEGQSTTSTFEIQHISPQSALRGHLCAGDVLVSHEWIDKPVVTGREAARALEKAIFGGLDVPLKVRPVGIHRDTQLELVIVNGDEGEGAEGSSRFHAGLVCSGENYSAHTGDSYERAVQSSL